MASRTRARLNNLNDRSREVGLSDVLTLDDIDALKHFYAFTCLKCGATPAISPDHVTPLSQGGANTIDNLQLLCDECNKAKQDTQIDYRNGKVLTRSLADTWIADNKQSPLQTERTYRKHNWDAMEFDYVTTEKTYEEIAQENHVHFNQLANYAAQNRWKEKREKFTKNLLSVTQLEAQQKEVSSRMMILEASKIALQEWKANDTKADLAQLTKILELAARVEGYELDKRTLTVKDWRDAANESDKDGLQDFATSAADKYFDDSDDNERGTGWTD